MVRFCKSASVSNKFNNLSELDYSAKRVSEEISNLFKLIDSVAN